MNCKYNGAAEKTRTFNPLRDNDLNVACLPIPPQPLLSKVR